METADNKFEIIHETISKADNTLSVKMLCEIAGVSRSGYYNWVKSVDKRGVGLFSTIFLALFADNILKKNNYGRNVHSFGWCRNRCMLPLSLVCFHEKWKEVD